MKVIGQMAAIIENRLRPQVEIPRKRKRPENYAAQRMCQPIRRTRTINNGNTNASESFDEIPQKFPGIDDDCATRISYNHTTTNTIKNQSTAMSDIVQMQLNNHTFSSSNFWPYRCYDDPAFLHINLSSTSKTYEWLLKKRTSGKHLCASKSTMPETLLMNDVTRLETKR